MVQRRQHLRLALEAGAPLAIQRVNLRQQLDGDVSAELRIAGAVDLTHTARTEQLDDLIGADPRAHRRLHGTATCLSDSSVDGSG